MQQIFNVLDGMDGSFSQIRRVFNHYGLIPLL